VLKPAATRYLDDKGNTVWVKQGFKGLEVWMSVFRYTPYHDTQRLSSKFLPARPTREQAQLDLDKYANKKGWSVYA
jgi:hypothetical protein